MLNSDLNIKLPKTFCSSESLLPGSIKLLHIEKLVAGGFSLGRVNGQVILCEGGIPGEAVEVEILNRRKGVMQGKFLTVQEASSSRVVPECPVMERCGGCQLQHVKYEEQLSQKRFILEDALQRIGKVPDLTIPSVIPSPKPYGYRHVLRMGIGKGPDGIFLGFFESGTQHLLPIETCFLVNNELQSILAAVRTRLRTLVVERVALESVEIRWSEQDEDGLLIFRGRTQEKEVVNYLLNVCFEIPHVKGCIYEQVDSTEHNSRHQLRSKPIVRGVDHLWEDFGGLRLKIGYRSFMQANWRVFQLLGEMVKEWLGTLKGRRILELYAGVCPLGLGLAKQGALVTCVEGNPLAIHDARDSIRVNKIAGCRVKISSVESYLRTVQSDAYDVILLDPPRAGLTPKILDQLGVLQTPTLLYLSCDVPTLARDIKSLCEKGYTIQRIQPFDMFPQTAHLETLVELKVPST